MDNDWITGKALETVLALNVLRPGDHVKVVEGGLTYKSRQQKYFIVHSVDDDKHFPVNLSYVDAPAGDTWDDCVSIGVIVAWRRPHG